MSVGTAAALVWKGWGAYARFGRCSTCREYGYVRAARSRGPFYCLDCFDQTATAARLAKRRAS